MTKHPLRLLAAISRLHIVAIAALGTFTFGWLWFGTYPWGLAAITALDWFLVNLLNRVVDLPEDAANNITGTDWVASHRRAIIMVGFSTLLTSLVAVFIWIPALTPLRVGFHALGFAYNWRLIPGRLGFRRIKELYFWKNTASAVGFLLTVFGFPLAAHGWSKHGLMPGISLATIMCSAGFFFAFELSYEVIYDLRDRIGDAGAGVRTYPVVHGERGAVKIIDGLIISSSGILVGGYAAHVVPWRMVVMIIAPIMQLVVYKRAIKRGITSNDCIALTWAGTGLLVAYHGWVLLGLPGVGI